MILIQMSNSYLKASCKIKLLTIMHNLKWMDKSTSTTINLSLINKTSFIKTINNFLQIQYQSYLNKMV